MTGTIDPVKQLSISYKYIQNFASTASTEFIIFRIVQRVNSTESPFRTQKCFNATSKRRSLGLYLLQNDLSRKFEARNQWQPLLFSHFPMLRSYLVLLLFNVEIMIWCSFCHWFFKAVLAAWSNFTGYGYKRFKVKAMLAFVRKEPNHFLLAHIYYTKAVLPMLLTTTVEQWHCDLLHVCLLFPSRFTTNFDHLLGRHCKCPPFQEWTKLR